MGGGLMQLVAYGAQDVYLTGNPQITFFKVVYRRHTNFSIEAIEQTFNGNADFGRTVTCNINRNGDLLTKIFLKITLSATDTGTENSKFCYVNRLGHAIIDNVRVEVGGSKIDEHYSDWLNVWYELTRNNSHDEGYAKMIGDVKELKTLSRTHDSYTLYIPLQFWFCRNNGLALPLIALQYHDVRLTVKFKEFSDVINIQGDGFATCSFTDSLLLIDYIYLDSSERKKFAQASHEYLIEQLQFTGNENISCNTEKYRLNFNHPSKFLVWNAQLTKYINSTKWVAYATDGDWNKALENFGKIIWLASRKGLNDAGTKVCIDCCNNTDPGCNEYGLPFFTDLENKVKGQFIFANLDDDDECDNSEYIAVAELDNVVLLENNFTFADMSNTLNDIINNANLNAQTLLNRFSVTAKDYFNYGMNINSSKNIVKLVKLQLNGHDRFQERSGNYFNYVQPYQHFSNTPVDGINVYSFAINPEEHQPSGTCNFSRIDNSTLHINFDIENLNCSAVCKIYTINYNILRIMSGMGGLAYSN